MIPPALYLAPSIGVLLITALLAAYYLGRDVGYRRGRRWK